MFVLPLMTAISLDLFAQDDADFAKEARFHRIYKEYNEKPTSVEDWNANLSNGHSQSYQIQKKDTLWEISAVLFGDPNFWPKIWSLNGLNVENPHEILPGQEMHFTEGTFGEPPALTMREGVSDEDQSMPVGEFARDGDYSSVESRPVYPDGQVEAAEIPEAKVPPTKLSPFPPSLPSWQLVTGLSDFQMEVKPVPQVREGTSQILDYYISENTAEVEGEITETEQGTNVASDRQMVYVRFNSAPTSVRYAVIKELNEVPDPWRHQAGKLVQVQGEIELIEMVNPAKNLYRARPVKNIVHFMVGAQVVPKPIVYFNSSAKGEVSPQVPARVIGGSYDTHRNLFGPQEIVFLNAGSAQGLVPNQIFSIFKNQQVRNPDSEVVTHQPIIGHLKVIQATELFATAVVTDVVDEIHVGDTLNSGVQEQ
jgi:hypothetical protein